MNKPIVYTILVTYNRLGMFKKCLSSVINQTYPIKKIIVVDNLSTDGTREYLKKIQKRHPKVIALFNNDNLGMANAVNKALKSIFNEKWDYVWISDDDNIAKKDALEKLILNSDKNTILNSLLIDYKNKKTLTFERIDLVSKKIYKNLSDFKEEKVIYDSIPLNFTLIPKEVFLKIGFFSEDYFIRGEEIDLILKAMLSNFNIKVVIDSLCYCLNTRNIKTFYFFNLKINRELIEGEKLYYIIRNNLLLISKYHKKVSKNQDKIKFYLFFPYLKYNLLIFFPFYFFYNIFVILFIQKSFIKNFKYIFLAYYHFIINKFGKLNIKLCQF